MTAGLRGRAAIERLTDAEEQQGYKSLNAEEKEELKRQFEEHKAVQAKAYRTSHKSRVNDVTHTMKAIVEEVSIFALNILMN